MVLCCSSDIIPRLAHVSSEASYWVWVHLACYSYSAWRGQLPISALLSEILFVTGDGENWILVSLLHVKRRPCCWTVPPLCGAGFGCINRNPGHWKWETHKALPFQLAAVSCGQNGQDITVCVSPLLTSIPYRLCFEWNRRSPKNSLSRQRTLGLGVSWSFKHSHLMQHRQVRGRCPGSLGRDSSLGETV